MKLKALEIQGFKSFPDRIRVGFDHGITAVVGPNGSGKSNISDAIRWVLGETSSKQLRGGGKMEDVIFGGTPKRSAMGFACVNLVVDNTDRRVDVDNDEVIIGRKYYRSGDSEYSVNGQNVRLKDVYEMFLDTGLGRDGYSIIGQGRIAEIVGAKSGERREIFEEASGIARYRYRKNEAERRLNSAEENLLRLRDILAELEERVGPLEKDSQKAKTFLDLSTKRKGYEITLWMDTIHKAKDTVRDQQRKIEIASQDYDKQTQMVEEIDAKTEETRGEIQALILQIERYNADIREITQKAAGCDAKIAVLNNDISHNNAAIDTISAELRDFAVGKDALGEERNASEEAVLQCEEKIKELNLQIEENEALLTELTQKSETSGEKRGAIAQKLNELTNELTNEKVNIAKAQSAVQAARETLLGAGEEKQKFQNEIKEFSTQKSDTAEFLSHTKETLTQLDNIKNGLEMKLQSRQKLLADAQEQEQMLMRAHEAAIQKRATLEELERNLDGFSGSVKTVIKASRDHRLRGIIDPVSGILNVKSGYEIAVETALGFALQNIVVENETCAKAGMAFLRDEKAGRATFLPLDTMRGSFVDRHRLSGNAICAADAVEYDARYENVVANLLGRIIIVDDINDASRVAKKLDYHNRVVTKDGQVVNAGGSFTGGSVSRSAGLFSRKQEIEELSVKARELSEKKAQAREKTDKLREENAALSAELTATQSEIITANGDKIRAETEMSRIEMALLQSKSALDGSMAKNEALLCQISDGEKEEERATQALQKANDTAQKLEQELAFVAGDDDGFLQTRQHLQEQLQDGKMQRLTAQKDADLHRATIAGLMGRTDEAAQRQKLQTENLQRLQVLNVENAQKIEVINAELEKNRNEIVGIEQAIKDVTQRRIEKEGSITAQTNKVREITLQREELSREIARLTEKKTALEIEYDQTVAKLWEEYELTPNEADTFCIEFDNIAELRRLVSEVRGKIKALGNVNVGAIEEYAEVSGRYTFMKAQVSDVQKSKTELEKMIAELCNEMRAMFKISFENINQNFKRIFTELFGGGSAALTLANEEDILESGIEIEVSPPGKIIKNLSSLSGGEQALVAISIYFAILAVNPAPFCVLDEIEAALDDVNVTRYAQFLRKITDKTQFVVITHRRGTMEEADVLYGVTMQEDGVSKMLKLDLDSVDATLVS